MTTATSRTLPKTLTRSAALLGLLTAFLASAGQTDISPVPLITVSPQVAKPNLMFIMDDSGSMAWTHMPDTVANFARDSSGNYKYGYVSSQCNGVYYNPSLVYTPPTRVMESGGVVTVTTYPNSSFTNAWVNGYDQSGTSTKVNLSTSFRAWTTSTVTNTALDGTQDTAQAAYYYTYSGTETTDAQKRYLDSSSTFYTECNSTVGSLTSKFTKVTVSSTSGTGPAGADERTNFANWYSYYRTRMLTMKTATGNAFKNVTDQYRVGYMSINNNGGNAFLNINDFGDTQRLNWYSKLYAASPSNSTPLREALSNAGRIYANKISTLNDVSVTDPVKYSCQKNFALLSTDGYWNGNAGFQVDGSTAVGNQDSGLPKPYNDGGTLGSVYTSTITVTASNSSDNVTSIKIDGKEILSNTATASGGGSRSSRLASNIVSRINACTSSTSGNCTVVGYSADRSGNVITITAPASAGAVSFTPVVTANGNAAATVLAFTGSAVSSGGNVDTLADVAAYYYKTDLRSGALNNENGALGTSVEQNNVLPSGDDDATWQHMTTFTLGLGAPGRMIYSPSYKADKTGHFAAIRNGSAASTGECPWQSTGTCTWPEPGSNNPENIDDLWHAAVNGRGTYFSAKDPAALSVGLVSALQGINALTSDAAAASTSNPNVTNGDNYIFSSTFRTAEWYGELERRQIDTTTGVLATNADWTAAAQLDAKSSRTIYTFDDSLTSTTKRKTFEWSSLTLAERAYFTTIYISSTATPPLNQFCASGEICLSAVSQATAGGQTLVDFLRGDRTHEGPASDVTKYFRQRVRILGDIVNSEAVYVKLPQFDYVDSGYSSFKTTGIATTRKAMVYVGANDGMLHAFDADNGEELWAYVPKLLFPKLYRLADKFYPTNHQYYVDGSPTVGDVYDSVNKKWRTILVSGFGVGGRGYFALDITDPINPLPLWEFTDANMGLSVGRPEITKVGNQWVAIFTSGYNNVNPGDGKGYLYVVDAVTGATVQTIGTGVGSDTGTIAGVCATAPCPSGLGQIRAFVENTRYDNTTTRVYGGDLFGNLWRFDVNGNIGAPGVEAQLIAELRGPAGKVQSLTARPELGKVAAQTVVFVGTGRYLGASDLTNVEVQSLYAIKDNNGSASVGNPRSDQSATGFVKQILVNGVCGDSVYCTKGAPIRTSGTGSDLKPVNFATQKGWFIDLPATAERANTDPQLALGTLAITTNILDPSACSSGGSSFINFFDYRTGQAVSSADGVASVYLDAALATRTVQVKFSDGKVRSIVRLSNNTTETQLTPLPPNPAPTRRTSWRELVTE